MLDLDLVESKYIMTEENKRVLIKMANSVGLPLDLTSTSVLLDFIELINKKGNMSTMKDVDDIVLKYMNPKDSNKENNLNDEQQSNSI